MNNLREELEKGPMLGFGIMWPQVGMIERIGPDWDWFWIDGQHGELDYSDVLAAVRASNLVRRPAVVRVPGHEPGPIGKMLDTACEAVMVPMVETAEEARALVRAAKFPPLGSRSYGGRRPVDLFGRSYSHADRPQPMLVCQIETVEGARNAPSIAAVDGVDALFFGPDDMAMRMGMPMDQPRPKGCFDKEWESVARAAAKAGKFCGGVFTTPDVLRQAVAMGYRLIVASADSALVPASSKEKSQALRSCLAEAGQVKGPKEPGPAGTY